MMEVQDGIKVWWHVRPLWHVGDGRWCGRRIIAEYIAPRSRKKKPSSFFTILSVCSERKSCYYYFWQKMKRWKLTL